MDAIPLTKSQAIGIFGGRQVYLARALGVSKQAVWQWPDVLDLERSDRVVGAAYRLGLIGRVQELIGGDTSDKCLTAP